MVSIPSSFSRKFTGALVLVIIALLALLWFYNHRLNNIGDQLSRVEEENAKLIESEARISESWAIEVRLNQALMERNKNVDKAFEKVDTTWGSSPVHDSVLRVLQEAGICSSGYTTGVLIEGDTKAATGSDNTDNK